MEYREFAVGLAKQAGAIIKKNFELDIDKEWKSDSSPVTDTDIEVNKIVIEEIKKHFPDQDILGEEESHRPNNSQYLWVCDPIDGTYNFIHHFPIITFSLALVKDGQPILGVIFDPFSNELYYAEKGKGAFLNDKQIFVSTAESIDKNIIELSMSPRGKFDLWPLFKNLSSHGGRVMRLGSTIYAGGKVASGSFIATIYANIKTHDVAAIKIIVEEAGGKVTDLYGNDQRYDQNIKGLIASNEKTHDAIVQEVLPLINS